MFRRQLAQLADRRFQELGVGRKGDVLRLHRGIDSDPGQIALLQSAGVMGQTQALGQKNVQVIADALPPMAHAGALVRQLVLEELLAGEVLEIRVLNPTVPNRSGGLRGLRPRSTLTIRQAVGMFQHKHADHEPYRLRRAALVGKASRQLVVEPGPVDLVRQDDKLVFHVDDLIETGAEKIVMARFWWLFRSHLNPRI